MNVLVRKILFFILWYPVYYTLWIYFLAPSIFTDLFYVLGILLLYAIGLMDTIIRPLSTSQDTNRKTTLLLTTIFLTGPPRLILSYYENLILILPLLSILNSLFIAILGLVIFLAGGLITLLGRYTLGKYATGKLQLQENHSLITHGIYKRIRNPIYLGALIGALGIGLTFRSYLLTSLTFVYYFLVFNQRIKIEEQMLVAEFGEEYEAYRQKSHRLIPGIY